MVVLRGRLTPEVGAVLMRAVEAALVQVPANAEGDRYEALDETTIAQRQADALGLVAESALAGGLDPGNSADRFQVTVHVQADTLAASEARRGSAEARSASPTAAEPTSAAAHAAPRVAAETRASSPAASVPTFAAGRATPHIAAETRAAGPAAAELTNAEADAVPHVAAETRAASSTAAEPTPALADTSPGDCPAPAAKPPLRDKSARPGGGGAEIPATPGPAPVPPSAAAETKTQAPIVPEAKFAAPYSDRDQLAGAKAGTLLVGEAAEKRASWMTDLDAGLAVIEQAGGLHVGREAARRVACDAGVVVLSHGADGEVLDVGRRTRTVPSALRRALQSRDHGRCQFPGCDSRRCDAHHVEHWADGGATRLQNLVS